MVNLNYNYNTLISDISQRFIIINITDPINFILKLRLTVCTNFINSLYLEIKTVLLHTCQHYINILLIYKFK